jgi:hypothetical protein
MLMPCLMSFLIPVDDIPIGVRLRRVMALPLANVKE